MVGVGMSQKEDSREAARDAAFAALGSMRGQGHPSWAITFIGSHHQAVPNLEGLRAILGNIPIYGGSCIGGITKEKLGYTGYECVVSVFSSDIPTPASVTVDLGQGEYAAGLEMGKRLGELAKMSPAVLLFYDSIKTSPPPVLHVGSWLLDGLYDGLRDTDDIQLLGAGLVSDFGFTHSFVFDGEGVREHAATAIILPPCLQPQTRIMHGCIPVSSFLEITRIEGPVLYELDGRPALDVIQEMAGTDVTNEQPFLSVTIGEKHGDPYAPYDESAYVNRVIMRAEPQDRSIVLFEADFRTGAKIQLMSRDNMGMLASVRNATRKMREACEKPPIWALYIDCAGRTSAISGSEREEANVLREEIGAIPVMGLYSGVEIAPLLGRSRPLDWTAVLTVFTLERPHE